MENRTQNRTRTGTRKGITVDWIVVTASLIGLAIVAWASIQAGDGSLAGILRNAL